MRDGEPVARAFVAAREDARGLPTYPGEMPTNLRDAYAIQDTAIALTNIPVGGWKVGKIPAPLDAHFGSNRLAGPIFTPTIVPAAENGVAMPVFADGFAAAEAEFLLRIGPNTPDSGKTTYSHDEAAALLDAVHIGIEIASSPYPEINAHGPAVTISDFGNNYGLIVGAEIADWRSGAFIDWPVELLIDGEIAGATTARTMLDGPIGAAAFLFGLAAERGMQLKPGQWISSGAVTGVHEVRPGQTVVARFDGATVNCTIEAAAGNGEDGANENGD